MRHLVILLVTILSSAVASAAEYGAKNARFTFYSRYSIYACDYVESRTKVILTSLGATDVKVRCSGGLDPFNPRRNWPANVQAEFTARVASGDDEVSSEFNTVIKVTDSCDLHETIIKRVLPSFVVADKKVRGSCWDSEGRKTYWLNVLK